MFVRGCQLLNTAHLLYPEWQGYGVANAVHHGAVAIANTLFPDVTFTTIDNPLDERLTVRDGVLASIRSCRGSEQPWPRCATLMP